MQEEIRATPDLIKKIKAEFNDPELSDEEITKAFGTPILMGQFVQTTEKGSGYIRVGLGVRQLANAIRGNEKGFMTKQRAIVIKLIAAQLSNE